MAGDFDNYKFRCHYQGDLVTVPKPLSESKLQMLVDYRERKSGVGRKLTENQEVVLHRLEADLADSKVYKLSTGAKTKLTKIAMSERFGRRGIVSSKYFVKGLVVEKASRDLTSLVTGNLFTKCDERKENDWVTGAVDILPDDRIWDIKSSYDFQTFNKHLLEEQSDYYLRQLDCYMDLWGIPYSALSYTLIDTPHRLIDDEIRKLDYKEDIINFNGDVRDDRILDVIDLVQNHIYSHEGLKKFCQQSPTVHIEWFQDFIEIPPENRVHIVEHTFDKVRIEQRNECLKLGREFMNNIKTTNNINYYGSK